MEVYIAIFMIFISFVTLVGLIGNIIVIIVYAFDKNLKSSTNHLFINLSTTDILIVLTCFPVAIMDLINYGEWRLGEFICHMDYFMESLLTSVSSLTLISISLERLYVTVFPLNIQIVKKKRTIYGILLSVWIISALSSAPYLSYSTFRYETFNGTKISYCFYSRSFGAKIYSSSCTSLLVFAPSVILSAVYIFIILKLQKLNKAHGSKAIFRNYSSRSSTTFSNSFYSRNELNASLIKPNNYVITGNRSFNSLIIKRKQTITICLVSLAFYFCQIPLKIFQLFNIFYKFENKSAENDLIRFRIMNIIFLTTKFLYFLHGMSNPIIYNLMSTKFRHSFRNVVLCKYFDRKNQRFNSNFNLYVLNKK